MVRYVRDTRHSVSLCKLAPLAYAVKQLTTGRELKRQIVFIPRLEPLVELDLLTALGHCKSTRKKQTHDIGMIESPEDLHLAPHNTLIALDALLRDRFQRNVQSWARLLVALGNNKSVTLRNTLGNTRCSREGS